MNFCKFIQNYVIPFCCSVISGWHDEDRLTLSCTVQRIIENLKFLIEDFMQNALRMRRPNKRTFIVLSKNGPSIDDSLLSLEIFIEFFLISFLFCFLIEGLMPHKFKLTLAPMTTLAGHIPSIDQYINGLLIQSINLSIVCIYRDKNRHFELIEAHRCYKNPTFFSLIRVFASFEASIFLIWRDLEKSSSVSTLLSI